MTVLVAVLLMSGVGLVAVESVGYLRGGYNSAFWQLPLDEKLDHVAHHVWEWWWLSAWGVVGIMTVTGGFFGFSALLGDAGENVLASVALGVFVIAAVTWVAGLMVQGGAVAEAAKQRADSGSTPSWLHPLWNAAYLGEVAWIVGANLSYAIFGIAILRSGYPADWAGWVAVGGGLMISAFVVATKAGFPQLAILVPAILGVALLIT